MPEERSHIYEDTTGFETISNGFEVADDVWSCVKEEDGSDGIVGFGAFGGSVEEEEIGGAHAHFSCLGIRM